MSINCWAFLSHYSWILVNLMHWSANFRVIFRKLGTFLVDFELFYDIFIKLISIKWPKNYTKMPKLIQNDNDTSQLIPNKLKFVAAVPITVEITCCRHLLEFQTDKFWNSSSSSRRRWNACEQRSKSITQRFQTLVSLLCLPISKTQTIARPSFQFSISYSLTKMLTKIAS